MSAVISYRQETLDRITLAVLLTPTQFRTVLLVACGLKKCEIAELLGTRERVIENVLRDIYDRTGCANSGDLVLRYVHEVEAAYWNSLDCGGNWKNLRLAQHRFSLAAPSVCSDAKASQHLAS